MKHIATALTALLALSACGKKKAGETADTTGSESKTAAGRSATATLPPDSPEGHAPATSKMLWVEEDYDKALALARAHKRPLVLDSWAAWCHTCMDMNKLVLTEEAMGPLASEFVWLRFDREPPEHAPVMAKFPAPVSPTYYVINSDTEEILGRQIGGSSASQFKQFLRTALPGKASPSTPTSPADAFLLQAERAAAAGDFDKAESLFTQAKERAPESWPREGELRRGLLTLLHDQKQYEACATFAILALPLSTAEPAPLGVMAFQAEMCARENKPALAKKVRNAILAAVDTCLKDERGGTLERSEAMQMRRYALQGLGRKKEARAAARQEKEVLDAATKSADSPRRAMAFQIVAAEVYAFLGEQGTYIPVLESAIEALPHEYHLQFLLGQLYYLDERYDDAERSTESAFELSYGPQRGIVYAFLAEVYAALGKYEKEEEARKGVLAFYEALPVGQRQAAQQEEARAALANITGGEE